MTTKTIPTFKGLHKGKGEKMFTTFADREAPGGYFYPESKHYWKKVSLRQRHTYMNSYSIDLPIIEELKARGCRTMEITVSDTGQAYSIPFSLYLKKMQERRYPDGRFPPRTNVSLSVFAATIKGLNALLDEEDNLDGASAA